MPTEVAYEQQEQHILQDGFCQTLQAFGLTLLRHSLVYTDPFVLKQRWLITPDGKPYHKKAFYMAFDRTPFRRVLRCILKNSCYTLDQRASSGLSGQLFTFLEDQEFLEKVSSQGIEDIHTSGLAYVDASKVYWRKGQSCQNISNIGPTLEWYVAECFREKHHALARHGVKIKELTVGGDLDVVALKDGKRIMVECKSSPHIEEQKLRFFLQRSADFQAHLTLLLIDTESPQPVEARTKMLCRLLCEPYDPARKQLYGKTVFRWIPTHNIYIVNTGASIAASLDAVLRFHDALAHIRVYR